MKTYKALELYPLQYGGYETMIETHAAISRVEAFFEDVRTNGTMSVKDLAKLLECSEQLIEYRLNGTVKNRLYLRQYLALMEVAGYELTAEDLNYAYANVIYTPKDIMRRMKRLRLKGYDGRELLRGYAYFAHKFEVDYQYLRDSCLYGRTRESNIYGQVMQEISRLELARGYDDALRFEE